MPVKDGSNCPGCGLANYEGLCPHCRGDQAAYEEELVPPFESSVPAVEGGGLMEPHASSLESVGQQTHDHGDEQIVVLTEVAARALVGVIERDAVAQPDWGYEGDVLAAAVSARQPARREWSAVLPPVPPGRPSEKRILCEDRTEAEDKDMYPDARIESRIVGEWEPVEEARDDG